MWGFGSAFVSVGAFTTITHITTAKNWGTWVGYVPGGQSLGFPTGLVVSNIAPTVERPAKVPTHGSSAGWAWLPRARQ